MQICRVHAMHTLLTLQMHKKCKIDQLDKTSRAKINQLVKTLRFCPSPSFTAGRFACWCSFEVRILVTSRRAISSESWPVRPLAEEVGVIERRQVVFMAGGLVTNWNVISVERIWWISQE